MVLAVHVIKSGELNRRGATPLCMPVTTQTPAPKAAPGNCMAVEATTTTRWVHEVPLADTNTVILLGVPTVVVISQRLPTQKIW